MMTPALMSANRRAGSPPRPRPTAAGAAGRSSFFLRPLSKKAKLASIPSGVNGCCKAE